jgi:pimeloyl-ACP methyl ester carboxylesterase
MSGRLRYLVVGLLAFLLLAGLAFVIWSQTPLGPMAEAAAALQSDEYVQVTYLTWIEFKPATTQPSTGLIFYPGARVDPRSYAPAARQIAGQGYLVVIVPMPLNLAVFGQDRAVRVIQAHPEIVSWAVGGHSLGGAMAASFTGQRPEMVDGLVLWASLPPESTDLSRLRFWAVSIYGSKDALLAADRLENTRTLLPPSTRWVQIDGGNHAQFGWYGEQPGDGRAVISREDQQELIVNATVELLQSLERSAAQ